MRADDVVCSPSVKADVASQLWTTRYAPRTLKEICGNKGQVEKLQQWLHDWSARHCIEPPSFADVAQVVELEIRVQEAREERYEHLSCRSHFWSTGYRKNDERALVCEAGGVHSNRA